MMVNKTVLLSLAWQGGTPEPQEGDRQTSPKDGGWMHPQATDLAITGGGGFGGRQASEYLVPVTGGEQTMQDSFVALGGFLLMVVVGLCLIAGAARAIRRGAR